MLHEIIIAGFGGQGVMSMGQIIAIAGMSEGKHVSWLPSYGPEQRGGTANVSVIVSDEPIGSPVVTQPSVAIVLNNPSFDKFEQTVKRDGILIVNASLVARKSKRNDITVIEVEANKIANELGNGKVANTVLLGAFLEISKALKPTSVINSLKTVLPEKKHHLIEINEHALKKGSEQVLIKKSNINQEYN